jgi:hypothetical protein
MDQTIATAYRLAVLFSSLCRSQEAHSSVAPAAQDVPPVSLLVVPPASRQVRGSQALAAPPVLAQVCWLQGVDALQVFQVARAERAPVPVSPLALQPVFPLASPQAFHSAARQGALPVEARAAPVSPPAPLLAAHLVVHRAAQQEQAPAPA